MKKKIAIQNLIYNHCKINIKKNIKIMNKQKNNNNDNSIYRNK
jgi:hypothetical protein